MGKVRRKKQEKIKKTLKREGKKEFENERFKKLVELLRTTLEFTAGTRE